MPQNARYVVAANRLPVKRSGDGWQPSDGGLASALAPVLQGRNAIWVGWSGGADERLESFSHDGMNLMAIPLSSPEIDRYYLGFCNETIWPLYHDAIRTPQYHRLWWRSYSEVNARYAVTLAELTKPGDLVWVHDYHLQLVPRALRGLVPEVDVRFFLHIPFPPAELFARLPWRSELIRGLLGARVLGFQTRRSAQHFTEAARAFSEATVDGPTISLGESTTNVVVAPISVDTGDFARIANSATTTERSQNLRRHLGNPELIMLGADRMDYTKGIDVRLRAFEALLAMQPHLAENTKFIQIAVPSRETIGDYVAMRETVERISGRINGTYGARHTMPVHYLYESLSREELCAYYRAADIMVVSPLADGMNLVAKEYVASRVDGDGVLLLSEFAGAAQELQDAVLINPYDIDGMARTMLQVMSMTPEQRRRAMGKMRRVVLERDIHWWANQMLELSDQQVAVS